MTADTCCFAEAIERLRDPSARFASLRMTTLAMFAIVAVLPGQPMFAA